MATGAPQRSRNNSTRQTTLALLLLVLVGGLNYVDRVSLSIAHGPVKSALHLSETQMGALLSIFSIVYGIAQLPIGPLLDRLGSRLVLGCGLALWSIGQLLVARVSSLASFFGLRTLLGIGESPYYPASIQIIHREISAARQARALALINSAAIVGQAVAPPLLTVIMLSLGWRSMFALTGLAGLLLTAVWFAFLREPRATHPDATPPSNASPLTTRQWLHLFRDPTIWLLMFGFGGVNYAAWFYIAWLPAYLENGRGLSIANTGWLAALPYIGAGIGMHVSGWLVDRQSARGTPAPRAHLRHAMFGLFASAAATLLVAHLSTTMGAIASIMAALFFLHFSGNSGWGYAQTISPKPIVATVCSIQNFGSQVLGSLAPFATGWLLDRTHHYAAAFALCAVVSALGALCYVILWRSNKLSLAMPTP